MKKTLFVGGIVALVGGVVGGTYVMKDKRPVQETVKVRDGFYRYPGDLQIVRENVGGELEIYLIDKRRCIRHPIREGMYVGDDKYLLKGGYEAAKNDIKKRIMNISNLLRVIGR